MTETNKTKTVPLQDAFLSRCQEEQIPVNIFLVSGIKLTGQIDSFDQYAIFLKNGTNQLIYKHQISTILPAR